MTTATAAQPPKKTGRQKMTVEEYIEFEEASELRHEYHYGKLVEMAGTTSFHNLICLRIAFFFMQGLPKKHFKAFMENLKVQIPGQETYYYPDIMVVNHPDDLNSKYIMRHPVLIAEVHSDSTRYADRNEKWADYQKIPSLQYYLMVEPEQMVVELFARDGKKGWTSTVFTRPEDSVALPELGLSLPLASIYDEA